jgi:hypothetical protein
VRPVVVVVVVPVDCGGGSIHRGRGCLGVKLVGDRGWWAVSRKGQAMHASIPHRASLWRKQEGDERERLLSASESRTETDANWNWVE